MTKARILADYVAGGTTAAEFDYMDGVTSNVQTQLTAKAPLASPAFTGTPTGITAAHITSGVLPVGVTGGSGLTALTADTMAVTGGYFFSGIQVFTSTGANTWTKPAGVTAIYVIVTAGGGGGGGSDSEGANGGGAGGTAIKWITSGLGSTETATVGAGGAGNTYGNNGNVVAGLSSFGSHCTTTGGGSADSWSTGGPGGTASNGNINLDGGSGQGGQVDEQMSTPKRLGGTGGSSYWGGGGHGASNWQLTPQTGRAYGSGGGGATLTNTSAAGKSGIIVVYEYKG